MSANERFSAILKFANKTFILYVVQYIYLIEVDERDTGLNLSLFNLLEFTKQNSC